MTPAASTPARETPRSRRAVYTWTTGLAGTAISALAGFVATPLLVRWLGDLQWGGWTVIGEWLGYLGLTQMALGPGALTIFLLRARNFGDAAALTAMSKRGVRLYALAALALAPAAAALSWWAPEWMGVGPPWVAPLRWGCAIASLGSLALAPTVIFRTVLETAQRGYLVRAALLAQSLAITGLSLWWVWMRWGLIGMAAANFVGMLLGAALWWWWSRPFVPAWRRTAPARLSARELWQFNWPLTLAGLGNQLNQLTDNTVVAMCLGPAAVAGFALTQSLPLMAGSQLAAIGGASWAGLGELRARDAAAFSDRVIELAATVLGLGLVLMSTLAMFNDAFVRLWVGARHYDGALLTWATAGSVVVFGFLCFFSWLMDTQGDARRRLGISSLGAALNLALSLVLIRTWGVSGVALGTLLAYICTDAWYLPYLAVRDYGIPAAGLLAALARAALRGGLWALGMAVAAAHLPPPATWMALVLSMALVGAAACLYCWLLVLRPADRASWRLRTSRRRAAGGQ